MRTLNRLGLSIEVSRYATASLHGSLLIGMAICLTAL